MQPLMLRVVCPRKSSLQALAMPGEGPVIYRPFPLCLGVTPEQGRQVQKLAPSWSEHDLAIKPLLGDAWCA